VAEKVDSVFEDDKSREKLPTADLAISAFTDLCRMHGLKVMVSDIARIEKSVENHDIKLDKIGCDFYARVRTKDTDNNGVVIFFDSKSRKRTFNDIFAEVLNVSQTDPKEQTYENFEKAAKTAFEIFTDKLSQSHSFKELFEDINTELANRQLPFKATPGWTFKGNTDCVMTEYPEGFSAYFKNSLQDMLKKNLQEGLYTGHIKPLSISTTISKKTQRRFATLNISISEVFAKNRGMVYMFKDMEYKNSKRGAPIPERKLTVEQVERLIRNQRKTHGLLFGEKTPPTTILNGKPSIVTDRDSR